MITSKKLFGFSLMALLFELSGCYQQDYTAGVSKGGSGDPTSYGGYTNSASLGTVVVSDSSGGAQLKNPSYYSILSLTCKGVDYTVNVNTTPALVDGVNSQFEFIVNLTNKNSNMVLEQFGNCDTRFNFYDENDNPITVNGQDCLPQTVTYAPNEQHSYHFLWQPPANIKKFNVGIASHFSYLSNAVQSTQCQLPHFELNSNW